MEPGRNCVSRMQMTAQTLQGPNPALSPTPECGQGHRGAVGTGTGEVQVIWALLDTVDTSMGLSWKSTIKQRSHSRN